MPRVKQFDEQDILQKAMDLFWRQGYHATSVNDLVEFLKVNRASLYGVFKGGKKEIFERALSRYIATNHANMEQFLSQDRPPKAILSTLFENAVKEIISDEDHKGCFVVNATTELAAIDAGTAETVRGNMRKILGFFKVLLLKAQERGDIDASKDIDGIAMNLFMAFSGLRVVGKSYSNEAELKKGVASILSVLD